MAPTPPLTELIAVAGPSLTPAERRLAEEVVADPTALAFLTVADLARRVETSGPTVVRFATKLGFDGFGELQQAARTAMAERLERPTDRIRLSAGGGASGDAQRSARRVALLEGVDDALSPTRADELDAMASTISHARGSVLVMCAETAAAPGHLLAANLRLLRPRVRHLHGSRAAIAAEVTDAGPDDVAVVIDFPRYEQTIVDTTVMLAEAGVTLIAITDGPLSPLASRADLWCGLGVQTVGPFDSALPTIAMIELLIARVADLLRAEATGRLDQAESRWADTAVFWSSR